MQSFQIAALPAYPVYYMRRTGPYGKENNLLMEQLKDWAEKKGLLTQESIILGVIWDGADTPPAACRYDACIVRDEAQHLRVEKLVGEAILPGGKYAVFTLAHTTEAISAAYPTLLPALAAAGHTLDAARPIIERYLPRLLAQHAMELCVPLL